MGCYRAVDGPAKPSVYGTQYHLSTSHILEVGLFGSQRSGVRIPAPRPVIPTLSSVTGYSKRLLQVAQSIQPLAEIFINDDLGGLDGFARTQFVAFQEGLQIPAPQEIFVKQVHLFAGVAVAMIKIKLIISFVSPFFSPLLYELP